MSDDEKRGFSGFGNLLSDVDTDDILKNVPVDTPNTSDDTLPTDLDNTKDQKLFGSKTIWFFAILSLFFIIREFSEEKSSTNKSQTSLSPIYSTTGTSTSTTNRVASEVPSKVGEVPSASIEEVPQTVVESNAALKDERSASIGIKAASFDCTEARSTVEILICSDQELSILDGQVGEAYGIAKDLAKDEDRAKKILLDQQRDFLKGRSVACSIPFQETLYDDDSRTIINCLKGVYQTRLMALEAQIEIIRKALGIEDVDGKTKQNIYNGVKKFIEVMDAQGVVGVQGTINNCYAGREPGMSLMHCMAFDYAASGIIPEIERKNNFPMTADFENSVYQGRMRKALVDGGVSSDPYEQAEVIKWIEGEAASALDIILKETVESEAGNAE